MSDITSTNLFEDQSELFEVDSSITVRIHNLKLKQNKAMNDYYAFTSL